MALIETLRTFLKTRGGPVTIPNTVITSFENVPNHINMSKSPCKLNHDLSFTHPRTLHILSAIAVDKTMMVHFSVSCTRMVLGNVFTELHM